MFISLQNRTKMKVPNTGIQGLQCLMPEDLETKLNKTKYFPLRQSEEFNNITHRWTDRQTDRVTSWASTSALTPQGEID